MWYRTYDNGTGPKPCHALGSVAVSGPRGNAKIAPALTHTDYFRSKSADSAVRDSQHCLRQQSALLRGQTGRLFQVGRITAALCIWNPIIPDQQAVGGGNYLVIMAIGNENTMNVTITW